MWFQIEDQLRHPDDIAAIAEAEEFCGGPMTAPAIPANRMLEELFGPRPSPRALPSGEPRRVVWVVKKAAGGDVRVLAERHRTIPRPDGTELRFYDGDEAVARRVTSFPAKSWHSVVLETALEPKSGEQ
ncbi:MAG: hypothetical protein ACK4UY_04015 [Dietzia sp.]